MLVTFEMVEPEVRAVVSEPVGDGVSIGLCGIAVACSGDLNECGSVVTED